MSGLVVGEVVLVLPPRHTPPGREQQMPRPVCVVATPCDGQWGPNRWPGALVLVVPFTRDKGYGYAAENPRLYPGFKAGRGGLSQASIALLDQAFAYDVGRRVRRLGRLPPAELERLRAPLRAMLAA